jgi:hypothetical protein
MKTKQYTIRNIPEPVDRYLRKRAKLSGLSINQVVIDELSEKAGFGKQSLVESLDWFIGSGDIGDDVLAALDDEDKLQKELTKKQWQSYDS